MPALINGYLSAEPDAMDELHQDGIVAGFFIYPAIEAVEGEERTKQMHNSGMTCRRNPEAGWR